MKFERYAVYVLPRPTEAWSEFCIAWLGWDANTGQCLAHPELPGLTTAVSAITAVPRRYGFHATIKPPFRLAAGRNLRALETALEALAQTLQPVVQDGLSINRLGRFLALTAQGDVTALNTMAATIVRGLDGFRAPATDQEMARRRSAGLTPEQDANLVRWGYPYVMTCFRFHMTLTGKLPRDDLARLQSTLEPVLGPSLPVPFAIRDLALVGEDADGFFHLIRRFDLTGA